jgi:hypothetical protein
MSRRNRRGRERRSWDDDDRSGWSGRRKERDRRPRAQLPRVERAPAPAPPSGPVSLLPAAPPEARTCGRCAEWLADEVGGRGECLHPGSGILKPWWDTPACDFFR